MADETEADEWRRVGEQVAARIDELKLTAAEIERHGGPSDKTLKRWIAGEAIVRADRARGLCQVLGWTNDSIDRIRRGLPPLQLTPRFDDPQVQQVEMQRFYEALHPEVAVDRRLTALETQTALIEQLQHRIEDLAEKLEVLLAPHHSSAPVVELRQSATADDDDAFVEAADQRPAPKKRSRNTTRSPRDVPAEPDQT